MTDISHQLYIKSTFKLLKSLLIHSTFEAEAIESDLGVRYGFTPSTDRNQWKYYLNLRGIYHAVDTPIEVISLDTLETIPFTKESLEIHRATAVEYQFGTEYYEALVQRYPDQATLIRGVVESLDFNIDDLQEGQILAYDESLVEENEISLMEDFQQWTYDFINRFANGYALVEPEWQAMLYGLMGCFQYPVISNMRLSRCNTSEVHEFHIRMHLASYYRLDKYIDVLNKSQKLFLYREIEHLSKRPGQKDTFDQLVQRLLTDREIYLYNYQLNHQISELGVELTPEVEYERRPVNFTDRQPGTIVKTPIELLDDQDSLAEGNIEFKDIYANKITQAVASHRLDSYPTRTFETNTVQKEGISPWTLDEQLMAYWPLFASRGQYRAKLRLETVATSGQVFVDALDGFILYLHCLNEANGWGMTRIPNYLSRMVLKDPLPSRTKLRSMATNRLSDQHIDFALSDLPPMDGDFLSIESFYQRVVDLQARLRDHYLHYISHQDHTNHTYQKMINLHLYQDTQSVVLSPDGLTFEEWLDDLEFDFSTFGQDDYLQLAGQIQKLATFQDERELTLGEIQRASVEVLKQLVNHNVHFITDLGTDPMRSNRSTAIRGDDIEAGLASEVFTNYEQMPCVDTGMSMEALAKIDTIEGVSPGPGPLANVFTGLIDMTPNTSSQFTAIAELPNFGNITLED